MNMRKIIQNNLFLILWFANSAWFSGMIKAAAAEDDQIRSQENRNLEAYALEGAAGGVKVALDNGATANLRVASYWNWTGKMVPLLSEVCSKMCYSRGTLDEVVKVLLEGNADPNVTCFSNKVPVICEWARLGEVGLVKLALENGAAPDAQDADGNTVFLYAARWKADTKEERESKKRLYNLLTRYKANVKQKNIYGQCPLSQEILWGHHDVAQELRGADANQRNHFGETLLHQAYNNVLNFNGACALETLFFLGADPWGVNLSKSVRQYGGYDKKNKRQRILKQREMCIEAARAIDHCFRGHCGDAQIDVYELLFKLPDKRTLQLQLLVAGLNSLQKLSFEERGEKLRKVRQQVSLGHQKKVFPRRQKPRISSHAVPNFVLTTRSTVSPWISWIKVDTRPAAIKQYMVRNGKAAGIESWNEIKARIDGFPLSKECFKEENGVAIEFAD